MTAHSRGAEMGARHRDRRCSSAPVCPACSPRRPSLLQAVPVSFAVALASLTPEERAREAEKEDLEEAEEPPSRAPSLLRPRPRGLDSDPRLRPAADASPSHVPSRPRRPSPTPAPSPSAEPSRPPSRPSSVTGGRPAGSSPLAPPGAVRGGRNERGGAASLIEKLPTFQDIDDIDLTTLLKVTADEERHAHGGRRARPRDRRLRGGHPAHGRADVDGGAADGAGAGGADGRRSAARASSCAACPEGTAAGSSENVLVTLNGLRLNESIFGGATAVNLDLPVDNIKRIEIVRGPGSVLDGPGAVLGVINIVTEGVDTFRRDELTVGGGYFKTFLYNYRYGTTFHEVSLAGFMQYSYTGRAGARRARGRADDPRPRPGPAGDRLRARWPPARPTTTARRWTPTSSLAYPQAHLQRAPEEGERGRVRRPARHARATEPPRQHAGQPQPRIPARPPAWATCAAASIFAESRLTELFDVYPPGFTLLRGTTRVVFPGGVLFQEDLNSRRLGADVVLERRLGPQHTLTVGGLVERDSTFGLDAMTNFDFEKQEPLPAFVSVPALVPGRRAHGDAPLRAGRVEPDAAPGPHRRAPLRPLQRRRGERAAPPGRRLPLPPRLHGQGGLRPRRARRRASSSCSTARPPTGRTPPSTSCAATRSTRRRSSGGRVCASPLTGYLTWLRDVIVPDVGGAAPPWARPRPPSATAQGIDARGHRPRSLAHRSRATARSRSCTPSSTPKTPAPAAGSPASPRISAGFPRTSAPANT